MVSLHHQRLPAALHAVDQMDLPQRSVACQQALVDARALGVQLGRRAGGGQLVVHQVLIQADPPHARPAPALRAKQAQVKGVAEAREPAEPGADQVAQLSHRHWRGPLDDHHARHVHRKTRMLQGEERILESGQAPAFSHAPAHRNPRAARCPEPSVPTKESPTALGGDGRRLPS